MDDDLHTLELSSDLPELIGNGDRAITSHSNPQPMRTERRCVTAILLGFKQASS